MHTQTPTPLGFDLNLFTRHFDWGELSLVIFVPHYIFFKKRYKYICREYFSYIPSLHIKPLAILGGKR